MQYYEFVHSLGLHAWDIPAFAAVALLVIMAAVHHYNQKKRAEEFEEELEEKLQKIRVEQANTPIEAV